ncbi:hypothetical protein D1007_26534 [Hordeum vulgare]|nr:hypothetical protein D1007_26534 [Hordeum vulgare]
MRETVLTRFCLKKGERVTHALIVSLVQLWITVAARPPLVDSGQHRFSAAAELFAGIPSLPSASSTAPIHRAPLPRTAPANARRCGRRRVLGATPLLSPFLCSFFSHFSQPMPPSRRSPPALLLELLRRLHRIRLLPPSPSSSKPSSAAGTSFADMGYGEGRPLPSTRSSEEEHQRQLESPPVTSGAPAFSYIPFFYKIY